MIVVPFTRTERSTPLHVRVAPPDGGLQDVSFAMCEHVRSISRDRLVDQWGRVSVPILRQVVDRLHLLMPSPAGS